MAGRPPWRAMWRWEADMGAITQRISVILLRGLLSHGGRVKAAWPTVYVRSGVLGGQYVARLARGG